MPEETLTKVQADLGARKSGEALPGMPFEPIVDGEALPGLPLDLVTQGSAADIAILAGSTAEEWKLFSSMDPRAANMSEAELLETAKLTFGNDAQRAVDTYREQLASENRPVTPQEVAGAIMTDKAFRMPALALLAAQHQHNSRTYNYLFDWSSPAMGGMLGACHAVELGFVVGTYDKNGGEAFSGAGPEADALAHLTMTVWINFARTGQPGGGDVPVWPAYDSDSRATMILGENTRIENAPADTTRTVWDLADQSSLGSF